MSTIKIIPVAITEIKILVVDTDITVWKQIKEELIGM
jgi:hypothetical protein